MEKREERAHIFMIWHQDNNKSRLYGGEYSIEFRYALCSVKKTYNEKKIAWYLDARTGDEDMQ